MPPVDDDRMIEKAAKMQQTLTREIKQRIVGQDDVVEHLLVALLGGGHVLLVGVPGLAKTLLVKRLTERHPKPRLRCSRRCRKRQ